MKNIRNTDAQTGLKAGMAAGFMFMIADWLIDIKGAGNTEVGMFGESNWGSMSPWRFEASILVSFLAMPLLWIGYKELIKAVEKSSSAKVPACPGCASVFRLCAQSTLMFTYFIHVMCCLCPIIFKVCTAQGLAEETAYAVVDGMGMYIIVPFMVSYMILLLGLSVPLMHMIRVRNMEVPMYMILFNPLCTLLLAQLMKLVTPWPVHDLLAACASFGLVLMFAAGMKAEKLLRR